VQPPFACDYGYSVLVGNNAFINFNAMILDWAPVKIGDGTQIGTGGDGTPCCVVRDR
jgi:maltose O-acetyltransferase